MKESLIEPVLKDLPRFVDDRGSLDQVFDGVVFPAKRAYLVRNGMDVIRAWHGHKREGKMLVALAGKVKIFCCSMNDVTNMRCFFLLKEKAQALYVPAGWYHGFKSFGEGWLLVFSDKTLEESKDDDFRKVWNDIGFPSMWEVEYR